ncbi:malonyl-CoA-acyl carrier protein transacylase, mitochondrial [Eurytemora carolleeae]|uniref:malonyl-CoA-acyl carrier protein transacylase, mitochondrial n=1 Tax=Eurytemora carolleeae TaxID=1294199 RepID=UPI000C75EC0B|nr:malonyl-CoA-acyl carrier protein transacylase, mitochondrial [Eurytemora carolleeae]|eukprot:XP_023340412.1 malonyl-CoA-acyl carrier protein transacylase, mitochondrial-like [Eurytemora affinis]
MQFVGMGQKLLDVPSVKELYNDASQILGYDLLELCLRGPKSTLDETVYCQPATVVSSLAAVELLYQQQETAVSNCMAVAGFSVGEITALIFTGAISFPEGINLVKIRAEAMQASSQLTRSGMMSVFIGADNKLPLGLQVAEEWCRREHNITNPVCRVANHLYTGAKVVAGNEEGLQFLEQNRDDFQIRKTKRLPVSGAFHTPLMQPAVEPFTEALKFTKISNPRFFTFIFFSYSCSWPCS